MRQILHVSDIHFGPPHLPDVAEGVIALAVRRKPDLVVISGDLTIRAKPSQFVEAREFVDRIEAESGAATLAIPGNHDVPLYRVWERAFAPYAAYRRHFSPELEPELEDDEMVVIGVNTAHGWTEKDGRITRGRLASLDQRLARIDRGKAKVVVVHHELAPAPRFDNLRVMRGATEAVDLFVRHGVDLVLAGHLHQGFIASSEAYYPSGRAPVFFLHAGTTTSSRGRGSEVGRNSCNWIEMNESAVRYQHLGWHPATREFVTWSEHRFPRFAGRIDGLDPDPRASGSLGVGSLGTGSLGTGSRSS